MKVKKWICLKRWHEHIAPTTVISIYLQIQHNCYATFQLKMNALHSALWPCGRFKMAAQDNRQHCPRTTADQVISLSWFFQTAFHESWMLARFQRVKIFNALINITFLQKNNVLFVKNILHKASKSPQTYLSMNHRNPISPAAQVNHQLCDKPVL